MNSEMPRRTFVVGSGVAAALVVGGASSAASKAEAISSTARFKYAGGAPAPWQPLSTVSGSVDQVTGQGLMISSETGLKREILFAHKPFIWNERVVHWTRASQEIQAGDSVVLCGELDNDHSEFTDLQQIWVNTPGLN